MFVGIVHIMTVIAAISEQKLSISNTALSKFCWNKAIFLEIYNLFVSIFQVHMGESFQDYSWIQDFEADFPQKVHLKMLNLGDHNSFSDLFSVCLRTFDHLNLKLWIYSGHTANFKNEVWKVQDCGNFELSPMGPWVKVQISQILNFRNSKF